MSYEYEGNGTFSTEEIRRERQAQERKAREEEARKANARRNTAGFKEKEESDLGGWIFIAFMFMVAWPIGLILLINKLNEGSKGKKKASSRPATRTVKATQAVTRTPKDSAKGARTMDIIGGILCGMGGLAILGILSDLGFYIEYGYLLDMVGELFVPAGLVAGGIALLNGGRKMRKRMRRFTKYLAAVGDRQEIELRRLASAAEVSERQVEKDLELMIEKGMWGDGAYVDIGVGKLFRSAAAGEAAYERARAPKEEQKAAEPAEGYDAVLKKIRVANDRIDDPVLSAKIDRLEEIARRIFRLLEQEPEKKDKASTFLNYYLPTTQKLLDSYAEFEEAGISGGNLSQAKRKIEQTMDNIVRGFERQLDDLYHSDALDIDSDIRVMETMLRRDGARVEDDFDLGGGSAVATEEE